MCKLTKDSLRRDDSVCTWNSVPVAFCIAFSLKFWEQKVRYAAVSGKIIARQRATAMSMSLRYSWNMLALHMHRVAGCQVDQWGSTVGRHRLDQHGVKQTGCVAQLVWCPVSTGSLFPGRKLFRMWSWGTAITTQKSYILKV